jgi:hypothetical protein
MMTCCSDTACGRSRWVRERRRPRQPNEIGPHLEECWRSSFARSLVPKITALRRDLDEYLAYTTSIGRTPVV